ncbi:ribonuclease H-like domain-containing protein [Tanacetum coccineum]
MSEAEPIPPTSSVTALRIPMIKKGEYDLWSMKMRQYIAITDHILWDIITNGDQATTDPVSSSGPVSAPKTSLAANARRNNEKALNILLSAIPDRHLLSFHDAEDAKTLWSAIKARFGGNEASKKMQKNLLKQQFETFTIGSREELDSAYERFQNILSMLELYDAKVSHEDANLKFLRSLPSVWHVVATMIRGQPGLDELEFDDLYNNLKVYEHELKGVSNSSSQNIAFLSTEIKGSTLKQSTADPENIPKGYTQAASSKVQTAPNCASHSDEIICSFFAQQASMPTTHDDEDLLQIDEDAMEEIDIRWQVAMITARIRKFMRKTGRPIDLKPKNGITFDKSKIECFNCQKLGHFARECRFAKYQENRANGRKEKKIVAIEDSNSKALVATDNNEEIDWTKEFDAEPVTFAMMALTELEEDDWSMEIDAESVHFGQDGLSDFDWSNKDDTPVSLALMATNSEVPYCSKCSKSYKQLLENYQTEKDNFQKARSEILGYQMSLESLEVILKTHEKNEYAWGDKYEQMEYDLKLRDLKLEEKQKELDQVLKERDDFKVKLEKWTNAAVLQNEVLNKQRYLSDKSCIGFGVESSSSKESDNSSGNTNSTESLYPNFQKAKGFHAVPPPTGTIIPPRANVSFTGIDELAIRNKVVNQENTKSSQPEIDRNKVIIEDWVDSDDEETALNFSEIQKKTVLNSENSETSFENRSPNSQNSVGQGSRKKGLGHKGGKTCFVCYSPDHLIKDCDLHERTFKQTQTHKPKGTQGSRDTRPVWNNINRVNHSNFSGNSRYPHQKRSFIPSAVLTREGLKSTARPKMTQTVPSKSTANVFYQGTARPRVPQAVLSQSTGRPYYPRMDNIRPRTSSFSPSTRSSTTRTPHRPQRPKKIMKSIWVKKESTVGSQAVLPQNVSVKGSAMINPTQTWRPKGAYLDSVNRDNGSYTLKQFEYGNPEEDLKDYAIIDSGCSGSMTGDKDKLSDFKEFKGGYVAFGNDPKGGRITGKGTIKTSCIDFEKVSYVEELKFNLLSVSQICDKKHNVLFTDKECLILSPKFKFVDEDLVILRAPRKNDVYSLDLKNIIPSGGVTCLVAKATKDEAVLWHRRLGHVNFKNINKLVKGNLLKNKHSRTVLGQEVPNIVPEEQALQMSFVSLMHQESIAKVHNDAQRNAFEEEKRRIALEKGKEISFFDARQHYLPSSDLNLPHTSGMDTFTDDDHMRNLSDSDDDVSKRGTIKPASTPIEAHKSLGKDEEGEDVDVHLYRFQVHSKDNESTICIVKNPVLHSKTKHIQIRHHFIRDCYEQRLINVVKVHTDDNVADLLTKGFDLARFNFWHIAKGKPLSPQCILEFIQLFFDQQLEGVTRPQNFLPSVTLPSKVFTFMRKNSPKFSGRITPLTPPMLEVITTLAAEEAHSESTHSRAESSPRDAQGTPTQSAAQASILQGTADFQGTAEAQGAADIPQSPNDYTPTDESQTSRGDEGLLDLYALNRGVKPLVKHHILWVKSQKLKKRGKKQKKKVSSVKLGRNKDEDAVTPDLERKSDETEQVIIEEEKDTSDVKSRDTEELDLERIQSTARQSAVTPRTLNFDDEAGPSSPIRPTQEEEPEEQFKDDEFLADIPTQYQAKKKKLTLQTRSELWRLTWIGKVLEKGQAEWDAEEERKRLEDLKKPKPKTISKKPTSLTQERNQMMSFLKGQGYKNLQKLKYPQMKELYDKVQESIKDSFKDFILIRMLDHGMEVEDESETAITLIHLFILWTTEDGDDS